MKKFNDLENLSKKYRRELFEKLLIIKQGHPGSIFSMMDIVVTLYHGGFIRFDSKKKKFLDKVLISKGHATAALYPILRDFGVLPLNEWNDWGHKSSLLRVFGGSKPNFGSKHIRAAPKATHAGDTPCRVSVNQRKSAPITIIKSFFSSILQDLVTSLPTAGFGWSLNKTKITSG